jgi:hypothetical protein
MNGFLVYLRSGAVFKCEELPSTGNGTAQEKYIEVIGLEPNELTLPLSELQLLHPRTVMTDAA